MLPFLYFQAPRTLPTLTRRPSSPSSLKKNCTSRYLGPDEIKADGDNYPGDVPKKVPGGIMCNVKGCTRVFTDRLRLMAHQLENSHIGYECPLCESPGRTKGVVRRHINSVHSTQRYECKICSKTFTRTDTLRDHVMKFHNLGSDSLFP